MNATSIKELSPQDRVHAALTLARNDLATFVGLAFPIVEPGAQYLANWHIRAICHLLERVARGECERAIITMPPRSLKSVAASVAFPAWLLGRDPTKKLICVSYADNLAVNQANLCRTLVAHQMYRTMFPRFGIHPRKNTENEFQTTQGGGRLATSTGGQLTGRGGDIIIIDDPMKAGDAHSGTIRQAVLDWYRSTLVTRLNNPREGAIVLVMQRLHVDDLAGVLLAGDGWEHLNLPAIAEVDERIQIGPSQWHERKIGDLLHAARLGHTELERFRTDLGSLAFSAQYQQSPAPTEGNLIKRKWFKDYEPDKQPIRHMEIIQSWDTAMKGDPSNDFSVCITIAKNGSNYFVVDVLRRRMSYPALLQCALEQYQQHYPESIVVEDHGSGQSLAADLDHRNFPVLPQRCKGDKETRLARVAALVESGNVHLPFGAAWRDDFVKELTSFPNARNDDQVDAFSQALIYLKDQERGGGWSISTF